MGQRFSFLKICDAYLESSELVKFTCYNFVKNKDTFSISFRSTVLAHKDNLKNWVLKTVFFRKQLHVMLDDKAFPFVLYLPYMHCILLLTGLRNFIGHRNLEEYGRIHFVYSTDTCRTKWRHTVHTVYEDHYHTTTF
jgi:hypothetical protein